MNETMAQNIYQSGFNSFQALASANVEDVMAIIRDMVNKKKLRSWLDEAYKNLIEQYKEGKTDPNGFCACGVRIIGVKTLAISNVQHLKARNGSS